ncbi:aminoacetone oxidase family FAD-binding enzyme [bacterium]|nr:aminoacetone oxidase family FAD-binding enzyme [bacterium]
MEQGLTCKRKPKVAIIGAGPSGCMCGITIKDFCDVSFFEMSKPLKTLLATGGGRCNLAHAEYDFKELAKAYPRGEKFLYSVFSRFSTVDTLSFFEKIGVKTYTQDDGRIFPVSNSAADVREKMLSQLKTTKFIKEKVLGLQKIDDKFYVKTENNKYIFDYVVVAIGTHSGLQFLNMLPHKVTELKPALCGLVTEDNFSTLKGVVLKNIILKHKKIILKGDMLFTDNGVSGPVIFQLSSINSREVYPYSVKIKLIENEEDFENSLKSSGSKNIKNVLSEYLPKSFVKYFLQKLKINPETKCGAFNGNTKVLLLESLCSFEITFICVRNGGETVFSGGVNLDEIDSNLESKLVKNLYFCGEILDVDGFCGGYNLQNCWSTGCLTGIAILKNMS